MTPHPRTRVAPAVVVGVLLLACAVGAQSITAPVKDQPLIRRSVAPPSSDFTTYIEGELVRVSIPSNWRELPGSNAVTFAPEAPRDCASDYAATFRRVVRSIEIMDCDRRALVNRQVQAATVGLCSEDTRSVTR